MKQYFEGSNKKKTWLIIAVIVVILALFFGTRSHKSGDSSGSSISTGMGTPRNVSFVQQAKGPGTHVWFYTKPEDNMMSKDSPIYYIYVLKNGKIQMYKIFDDNVTMGKLSKMNDAQVIKLAKVQNKKYATTGAIEEIKNYVKGNDDQIGTTTNFDSDAKDIADGNMLLNVINVDYGEDTSDIRAKDIVSPDYMDGSTEEASEISIDSLKPGIMEDDPNKKVDTAFTQALIKHIKNTPYKEPKAQTIKVKNETDDTGNKIIRQHISYDSVSMFDSDKANDEFYKYAIKHKADFLKLITLSNKNDYHTTAEYLSTDTSNNPDALSQQKEGQTLYTSLIGDHVYNITKDVYGYHTFSTGLTLNKLFVRQEIYKAHYIGYGCTTGYLLTRAQNDKQKVHFSK